MGAQTTVDADLVHPMILPFRTIELHTRPITVEQHIRLCGPHDHEATPGL